jgi:hypothetical protein
MMTSPTSQPILREASRIDEDCEYSSKGHYYAAQRWAALHWWVGIPLAIASGLAGTSALAEFDHHNVVAGVLALLVAVGTAVVTFMNPNQRAGLHRAAGDEYNALRNNVRIFSEIEAEAMPANEALTRLHQLTDGRNGLNANSPQIPKWAFEKARQGIEGGESTYRADAH